VMGEVRGVSTDSERFRQGARYSGPFTYRRPSSNQRQSRPSKKVIQLKVCKEKRIVACLANVMSSLWLKALLSDCLFLKIKFIICDQSRRCRLERYLIKVRKCLANFPRS